MLKIILFFILNISLIYANVFKEERLAISNVNNQTATIQKVNLKVGQSGVIVHNFKNNRSMILKKAVVISSDDNLTTIKFLDSDIFSQDSIATTNLEPQNNDMFILNHMYNISLLIVPNFESYKTVKNQFNSNFINSDLFAGYLKINDKPVPTQEDFQDFTNSNNISTIYFVINSYLYILDSNTFKVIKKVALEINDKNFQTPFYTYIENIEKSVFNFIDKNKIEDFDKYYLQLIGEK
jgi:hypothetical protein